MTFKKRIETLIIFFLLLIPGLLAHASSCTSVVNKISNDITKYSTSIESQHLNWMNLSWLNKNLGPAQVEKTLEGEMQYKWQCGSDNFLAVQTNSAGQIIKVKGFFSSDNGASYFNTNFDKSPPSIDIYSNTASQWDKIDKDFQTKVQDQINQEAYQQQLQSFSQQIGNYNQHFNTSIQNIDQLQSNMTNKIKTFSEKLRLCTPGTYQYAIVGSSDILYLTTTIKGKQGDLCIAETSYSMGWMGNVYVNCQFQPKNLQLIADHYPELALIKEQTKSNIENLTNKEHPIMDCKTTVTGFMKQIEKMQQSDKNNKQ